MNSNIQKLYNIAAKKSKLIIGLMSGTSLDGLDIALCQITGSGLNTNIQLLHFVTIPYTPIIKTEIEKVFAKTNINLQQLTCLNAWLGNLYGDFINQTLQQWNIKHESVDLIASHGQTVFHAPKRLHLSNTFSNATLQIADADHIAVKTGIITISDFRQKHIAIGGEGAPLAYIGDYILFSNAKENRVMLNIGGIANLTYLPANSSNIICTDVGPGNTLIDNYVRANFNNILLDDEGKIAANGTVNNNLLKALLTHSFFTQTFPKSTGQEAFNMQWLTEILNTTINYTISKQDVVATLTYFTAYAIKLAIEKLAINHAVIYISGGGVYNKTLLQNLQLLLSEFTITLTGNLGINENAKEAMLFALLANETIAGEELIINNQRVYSMGKISFPD
jgi:anhydro-N-acetylmuramic acid kinase